jgi:hypothetical protein
VYKTEAAAAIITTPSGFAIIYSHKNTKVAFTRAVLSKNVLLGIIGLLDSYLRKKLLAISTDMLIARKAVAESFSVDINTIKSTHRGIRPISKKSAKNGRLYNCKFIIFNPSYTLSHFRMLILILKFSTRSLCFLEGETAGKISE